MTHEVRGGSTEARRPLVSVGLPVYNGERYLAQAIDSILGQDLADFELIVANNASTDATARICQEYARRDPRVRYYCHDANIGAAPNHNFVVERARAKYFKWAAHDDECHPELLRRCVEVLEQRPEVVLAYPEADLVDRDGNVTGRYSRSIACHDRRAHRRVAHFLRTVGLGTPLYGIVRTEMLRRTRLHGSFISADRVLLGELAMLGEIAQVPLPLVRKRLHPGRSQEANRTEAELLAWFNPKNAASRGILSPGYQMTLEYLRGVWSIPISLPAKVACSCAVVIERHRGVRLRRRMRALLGLRPLTAAPQLVSEAHRHHNEAQQ